MYYDDEVFTDDQKVYSLSFPLGPLGQMMGHLKTIPVVNLQPFLATFKIRLLEAVEQFGSLLLSSASLIIHSWVKAD